ncbi:glycosyltransferase, partial [Mariniblastus sp.]|nr:glycosyltransferase [Mariniblastus sp.]
RLMYRHKIRVGYIPKVQVRMGIGGQSNVSIENRWNANASDQNAWLENGLKPPWGLRITKPVSKLPQYWRRP